MKKLLLLITIYSFLLTGCVQQNNITNQVMETHTGEEMQSSIPIIIKKNISRTDIPLLSGVNISGEKYTIVTSGDKILYSGLFSITIPKELEIWSYEKANKERLSFSQRESGKILTITAEDETGRRVNQTNKEKCTLGRYEEGVISKETISKTYGTETVYITNVNFSAFNKKRKQSDICFVKDNSIYKLSIGNYDAKYIQTIINSFKFLK